MKILIVDDSSVMRKLIMRSVRQAGFGDAVVVEASTGLEGLESIRQHKPDVVLADWNMPEMTGIEMLRKLRADDDRIRVGFVTSESTVEVRAAAAEAGANFFLTKPINVDHLADALAMVTS